MKYLFLIISLCCSSLSFAGSATYNRLVEVNPYWSAQKEAPQMKLPAYGQRSGKEWIRLHLSLVENVLRSRPMSGLSFAQQQLRLQSLDDLHRYWQAGRFPVNETYTYRTPIFIDRQDNFCAVGYLLKASGQEAVSRMIASHTNLAYVMDMEYPELGLWAQAHGFSKEELAWIQPGYPPQNYMAPLGKGLNGSVTALFVDEAGSKLYAGGHFTQADTSIATVHIAYATKGNAGNYSWHAMGSGVNGPVHAIVEYNGKIFAAGAFTMAGAVTAQNVAYWENGSWHSAGCTYGTIRDLIVFQGELYAAGAFDVCASASDINFARWTGSQWQQVPGLSGQINTMEVMGNKLLLGGQFKYLDNEVNAIAWNPTSGFMSFANGISNTVNDFEVFKGTMYAACRQTHALDTTGLLLQLDNNSWTSLYENADLFPFMPGDDLSLNTLLVEDNTLLTGGRFQNLDMMYQASNCIDVTPAPYMAQHNYFYADDAVNKMVWFQNDLIAAGDFRNGRMPFGDTIPLGYIGKRISLTTGIPDHAGNASFRIYPNPLNNNHMLTLENNLEASRMSVSDITGKVVFQTVLQAGKTTQQVQLPALSSAMFLLEISNTKGAKVVQKLLLQ